MEDGPPIPSGSLPPPRKRPSQLAVALAAGTVGAVGGAALAVWGFPLIEPLVKAANPWLFALLAAGATFAAVVMHELGHVLAGRRVGYRFMFLVVGPLRLERRDGRLRLGLNTSLALAGGLALSVPTDRRALARRYATVVAGGPAWSMLTGALGVLLAWWLASDTAVAVHAKLAVGTFGCVSLLLAVVTLLPMPLGDGASDGLRLLRLLRGGAEADRDAAILRLAGQAMLGERPRDWDRHAVLTALHPADGSPAEVTARFFAVCHARDRGECDETGQHASRLLEVYPAAGRPLQAAALLELLTTAVLDGRTEAVSSLLDTLRPLTAFLAGPHREVVAAAELALAGQATGAAERLERPAVRATYGQPWQAELLERLKAGLAAVSRADRPSEGTAPR